MALKCFDGFDHYANATDWKSRSGFIQYQQPATNATPITFPTGRNGFGKCLSMDQTFTANYIVFGDRNVEAIVGFGIRLNVTGTGNHIIFWDSLTGLTQMEFYLNPVNYTVSLYRGAKDNQANGQPNGTLVAASANNVWSGNVWFFLEIDLKIGSSGSCEVRINNEVVLTFSGNTVGPATTGSPPVSPGSTWDIMSFTGSNINGSGQTQVDDLYYCDTTVGPGSFPADAPLGDCRVSTLFAEGNDTVQWTPLANTNWQEVAEIIFDGDTTYNYTSTPGDQDLLNFQPLEATTALIYAVQLTGAYRKDDAGVRTLKQALKSGTTTSFGTTYSLPDSYVYFSDLWVLDPDTSANWTLLGVNGLHAGYNLVS